jgi:hypothetical protein
MKKIKLISGIAWAFAALILIIVLFPGLNNFSASAARLPFMKINPNYTGGEIASRFISEGCTLSVRKPVFDGLIGERKNGFVQVDWRGAVPDKINDTVDYNLDGSPDFCILINRKEFITDLVPFNPLVKKVETSTKTSYGWAVRVGLKK